MVTRNARGLAWGLVRRGAVGRRCGATSEMDAFAALCRSERLAMVRLAAFLVGDVQVAENIVQDAFAGLHADWHRLRDEHAAMGYLRRAVVHQASAGRRRPGP